MESPDDLVNLNSQFVFYEKELRELRIIKELIEGKHKPGDYPEIVTRAIRDGIALPLKYTHSFEGLLSLFDHSLITHNMRLYDYVSNLIIKLFSRDLLMAFKNNRPKNTVLPNPPDNSRIVFLKTQSNMTFADLNSFMYRVDIPEFFAKQMNRIIDLNVVRAVFNNSDVNNNQLLPPIDTLRASFKNETLNIKRTSLLPKTIIEKFQFVPIIYVTALFDAYTPTMNWKAILEHELLKKRKGLFKKFIISPSIIRQKLSEGNAPENIVDSIQDD